MADTIDGTLTELNLPSIEQIITNDLDYIFKYTSKIVVSAIADMIAEGKTIDDVKQALKDAGIFAPERALRASRTLVGTATSVGQLRGAMAAGATHKTWRDSGLNVRDIHTERNGETVPINQPFSAKSGETKGPMFPGDPNISAMDRINCRCAMTFSIQ